MNLIKFILSDIFIFIGFIILVKVLGEFIINVISAIIEGILKIILYIKK